MPAPEDGIVQQPMMPLGHALTTVPPPAVQPDMADEAAAEERSSEMVQVSTFPPDLQRTSVPLPPLDEPVDPEELPPGDPVPVPLELLEHPHARHTTIATTLVTPVPRISLV